MSSSLGGGLVLSVSGMNQTLAPQTEVPLRATQASNVEINGCVLSKPIAMHGVMSTLWCGGGPQR